MKKQPFKFEFDEISFLSISLIIAKQIRVVILISFLLSIYSIILVTFFIDPSFESHAKIMTSKKNKAQAGAIGLAAQFGINLDYQSGDPNWNLIEIIKSRTIAKKMLKRKFDTEKYGLQKTLFEILTHGNNFEENINTYKKKYKAVDAFIKKVNVSEDRKSGLFTVSISTYNPKFSVDLLSALLEELDNHQKTYNRELKSKARDFIEGRILAIGKELAEAENKLKDFTISNRRMENSPLLLLERERLDRDVTVLTGVFTMLKSQLENTKIEEVKESDFILILDPPEEPIIKSAPRKKVIVLKYAFSGIIMGIIFGFIREFIDKNKKPIINYIRLFIRHIR